MFKPGSPSISRATGPQGNGAPPLRLTAPSGIDLLGQITFTDKADEKLRPIIRHLEHDLPAELAKLPFHDQAASAWRSAFTSASLNDDNPPVWTRITPRRVMYDGYRIGNSQIRVDVGLEATTETFVGRRPDDPTPPPPPPPPPPRISRMSVTGNGFNLFVPVTADYAQLEPVILRALVKRSARPFLLPSIGPVAARFDHLIAYGTTDGRIAVGIDLLAHSVESPEDVIRGRIWLTARPVNASGSARVGFADLSVAGDTDRTSGNLLVTLGNSPGVSKLIASVLQQNLSRDLGDLVSKVRRAVAYKRIGDLVVQARINRVRPASFRRSTMASTSRCARSGRPRCPIDQKSQRPPAKRPDDRETRSRCVGWKRIDEDQPPIGRPILVRTLEGEDTAVSFLDNDGIWYAGGAMVIGSSTLLGTTPIEWCEPGGDQAL